MSRVCRLMPSSLHVKDHLCQLLMKKRLIEWSLMVILKAFISPNPIYIVGNTANHASITLYSPHYGQNKKTTLWSKEKDNTTVKRKRQHYGQKKKTSLRSKEKENTMVKRKRQHCRQNKKTTLWSKEKDNNMVKRKRQYNSQNKKTTL